MDKTKPSPESLKAVGQQVLEFGGLRFDVAFRSIGGATFLAAAVLVMMTAHLFSASQNRRRA